jgi:peptidyl-prolyl cis-trans isomerase C
MRERKLHYVFIIVVIMISQFLFSCNAKEEKPQPLPVAKQEQPLPQPPEAQPVMPAPPPSAVPAPVTAPAAQSVKSDIIIEVNGKTLARDRFDKEFKKTMATMKGQVPAKNLKEFEQTLKKRMVDGFVTRTLLAEEIERKQISVSTKEIADEIQKISSSLPQGVTMEDLMKKNNISKAKMDEDIRFAIQVNKLVSSSGHRKLKPTDKEIGDFYQKNKEKFMVPETAHARHILIAKAAGDDDKMKAEKRAKAEALRKELEGGADFAQLATQNSDCPSKSNGGDLGVFSKGQMVKPFEDAAFSQKIKEIGAVVETDFGFHIIEVLERKQPQTMELNDAIKKRIASVLEQQKLQEGLGRVLKELQTKATIIAHEKF